MQGYTRSRTISEVMSSIAGLTFSAVGELRKGADSTLDKRDGSQTKESNHPVGTA